MAEFKHLKLWQHPDSYMGKTYYEYYPVIGQHRDSNILGRCNFDAALQILKDAGADVIVARASHWAVGWVETILVHMESSTAALQTADDILDALEQYPVLDDEKLSEMESEEMTELWEDSWIRRELCEEFDIPPVDNVGDTEYPDEIPNNDELVERLRGYLWHG